MRDHLAWSGFGFRVLVREEDAAAAREVLYPPHMAPEGNLVVAQVCGTHEEADVVRGALESAGIAAAIETERLNEKNSMFFGDHLFRVMVREEDASAAREVLKQSDEPRDEAR